MVMAMETGEVVVTAHSVAQPGRLLSAPSRHRNRQDPEPETTATGRKTIVAFAASEERAAHRVEELPQL
jgi:hypothetical protein